MSVHDLVTPASPTSVRSPRHAHTYSYGEAIPMVASPQSSRFDVNAPALKHRTTSMSVSIAAAQDAQLDEHEREHDNRTPSCCVLCQSRGICASVNWSWWLGGWLRTRVARVAISCAVIAVVLVITIVVGELFLVKASDHGPPEVVGVDGQPPRKNGLFLYGGIRKWDMTEKTLSTRWLPYVCGEKPTDCFPVATDVSFFINDDALGIDGFNASASILDLQAAQAGLKHSGWEQFIELDIATEPRSGELNLNGLETDSLYPFDWYRVQVLVAATSADLNSTYPVIGANVFNKVQAQWIASTEYSYLDGFQGSSTKLWIRITLRRNMVIKISAFLIIVFNWMVTLAILYMTLVYTLGRRQLPDGLDSVALPFAGLFALPSVRGVMPGDPPFGCLLDFIGIVPNLSIVAGCATCLLLMRIHRESLTQLPERKREPTV
ncbi:hypothetical protein EXIGLDRAFT_772256 [Exidia glandulosa HHB12029]|uniref:Transmembrane protein n=1 Tax=Exidia glandulosa HHB12029 TaxID=1314781 RepID=A0A165FEX0_EXIGL|nr:hypothetical protein EXIGLDRAFT_772256 [Exidia glandulosa HHB12029]